jgi:hypothetical protein
VVAAVVCAVTPELMANAAAVDTASVAFLTQAICTVGLFLIRLVLAVGHAITGQAIVDAVTVATLKVIHVATRYVQSGARVVLQETSVSAATAVDPSV